MRKIFFPLICLALGLTAALAQENKTIKVTYKLLAPGLSDTTKVYITGSAEQLGNWDPGNVMMEFASNHTWTKQITLLRPQYIEYKFTRGSWNRQATNAKGEPLPNYGVNLTKDTTVTNTVEHWIEQPESPKAPNEVTGNVKLHTSIRSSNSTPARDIVVWLPEGYEENKNKKYPVLYMHDGQNIFNPATSSFGVDWRIDETADSLIKAKIIDPVIIVGIYNTPERMEEYIPGDKGTAYMKYVVNDVKPFVDQAYRTKKDRKNTFTGGSSAGGTISFMLAWEYPRVFSKAICMSPAFKIQQIDYVDDVTAYQGKKKKLFFYIDNGGIELEERLQPGIDEMLTALKAKGYEEGKDYVWIKDPKAKHFEAAWAKRMPAALKFILPRK